MTISDSSRHKTRLVTPGRVIAGIGALGLGLVLAAAIVDISGFDRTRGGYEPPFDEFTGTPTDWSEVQTTESGMLGRGLLIDFLINCTTGMISIRISGIEIPFRPLSDRAIAVHKPREACVERGFSPEF